MNPHQRCFQAKVKNSSFCFVDQERINDLNEQVITCSFCFVDQERINHLNELVITCSFCFDQERINDLNELVITCSFCFDQERINDLNEQADEFIQSGMWDVESIKEKKATINERYER